MASNNSNGESEERDWDFNDYTDQKWKSQQTKTFTNWINSHLRKANLHIDDIFVELRDGRNLIKLLDMLSTDQVEKPDKGNMRLHMIANVNKALHFIAKKGVKLVSIGAEEIVDGNQKLTLGMIWTVILRFAIEDISVGDATAKEGLLLWCQRRSEPYPNVKISNFTTSFKDGLAFLALLHSQDKAFDYKKYSKGKDLENLTDAFDIAEKKYDIMQMLDPEELVSLPIPDEHSIMAYVSSYYHAFSGAEKSRSAAHRIAKVIAKHMEDEKDIESYNNVSTTIFDWIDDKTEKLSNLPTVSDRAALESCFNNFRDYRQNEKPPKLEEKSNLSTTFETLQTRLRLNDRPPFVPEEGKSIKDLAKKWDNLEMAEKNYESWLLNQRKRHDRCNFLIEKFEKKSNIQKEWSVGKSDLLDDSKILQASLSQLKRMIRKQEAFESELQAQESRVKQLDGIVNELREMNFTNIDDVNCTWEDISKEWDNIQNRSRGYMHRLRERATHLDEIDMLQLEFAKKAVIFYNWMTSSIEDLEDKFQVISVAEIEDIIADHDKFKSEQHESLCKLEDLQKTEKDIIDLAEKYNVSVGENEYTLLHLDVIVTKFEEFGPAIAKREEELYSVKSVQLDNEKLRVDFAQLAKSVNEAVDECAKDLEILNDGENTDPLEKQIDDFAKIEQNLNDIEADKVKLEGLGNDLVDAGIFNNEHTSLTVGFVISNWHQQKNKISHTINEIRNQILLRDTKGITDEEMQEYRKAFFHFDKNKTKSLEYDEFKSCLISLGRLTVESEEDTKSVFLPIIETVDPNGTGSISFTAFMEFMSTERGDVNTADQITKLFRTLAGDKPYITADILRKELGSEQAEFCISRMCASEVPDAPEDAYDFTNFSGALYDEVNF